MKKITLLFISLFVAMLSMAQVKIKYENSKYGLYNENTQKWVLNPSCYYIMDIGIYEGAHYYAVCKEQGSKYGVIRSNSYTTWYMSPTYDEVVCQTNSYIFTSIPLLCVRKNDKWGIIELGSGEFRTLKPFKYRSLNLDPWEKKVYCHSFESSSTVASEVLLDTDLKAIYDSQNQPPVAEQQPIANQSPTTTQQPSENVHRTADNPQPAGNQQNNSVASDTPVKVEVMQLSGKQYDKRYESPSDTSGIKYELMDDSYPYKHRYYKCTLNGKIGVVDERNCVVLPIEYDRFRYLEDHNWYFIYKGNMVGLINKRGYVLIPAVTKNINLNPSKNAVTVTEWDGNVTTVTFENINQIRKVLAKKYNTEPIFDIDFSEAKTIYVDEYWTTGTFRDGMLAIYNKNNKKVGYLNENGDWAIPCNLPVEVVTSFTLDERTAFSGDHFVMYSSYPSSSYCVYDKSGKITYKMARFNGSNKYDITRFVKGGYALHRTRIGSGSNAVVKFKFIDPSGQQVFNNVYGNKSYSYVLEDRDMKSFIRPMCEDMAAYIDFVSYGTEIWGFFNKSGQVVVPAKYKKVHDFSEGLAAVQMRDNGENANKWGFIDKTGKMVIPARFSNEPSDFNDGYACVKKTNGNYVYIDKQGNVVSGEFANATSFNNGYAFVRIFTDDYVHTEFSINREFQTVRCHLPENVFSLKNPIYNTISTSGSMFNHDMAQFPEGKDLIRNTGEFVAIYCDNEYTIKHCSENLIHIEYGQSWNNPIDIFCDYTGKVKFIIKRNEF